MAATSGGSDAALEAQAPRVAMDFRIRNTNDLRQNRENGSPTGVAREALLTSVPLDTAVTMLCLAADLVARLGLGLPRLVYANTAMGIRQLRVMAGALVEFEDRQAAVEVLEVPEGQQAVMGWLTMACLGIEPDIENGSVHKLDVWYRA